MNYQQLIEKARRANKQRDQLDRRNGFAAPNDGPIGMLFATAFAAIEAGITTEDWSAIAEGLVMLQDDPRIQMMIEACKK